MSTFYQRYQRNLATTPLQGPWATKLWDVLGGKKDACTELIHDAVLNWMVTECADDTLLRHGQGRGLEWVPQDTFTTYRTWVLAAWDTWHQAGTRTGLTNVFLQRLYCPVHFVRWKDWASNDADLSDFVRFFSSRCWATFFGIVDQPNPWKEPVWGSGWKWGDGAVWGITMNMDDVARIRRHVWTFKAAHFTLPYLVINKGGTGAIWNNGWKWGDGTLWGGAANTMRLVIGERHWFEMGLA